MLYKTDNIEISNARIAAQYINNSDLGDIVLIIKIKIIRPK